MAIPYEPKPLPAVTTVDFAVDRWAGVNKIKGSQADYEMADCINMSSDNYPYASPKKSAKKVNGGIWNAVRIYKVEDNKVYYIDPDGELVFADLTDGGMDYVLPDNITGTPLKLNGCTCTNNYDDVTVFYPEMVYLDKDNKLIPFVPKIIFGEVPDDPTETLSKNNETVYRLSVFSQSIPIEVTTSDKITVEMTLPSAKEYGYNQNFSPSISMEVYNKNGTLKFDKSVEATVTGRTNAYSFNLEGDEKLEKGDYIIFELYLKNVGEGFRLAAWKSMLKYAVSAEWIVSNKPVVATLPLDYGVVYNNRIVGVNGSDIRASALGDFTNFWSYVDEAGNPDATGAYATDVGSSGDFTGICVYNNVLLLFKKDIVYEMYGSMPYTITELCTTGCIDNDSIVTIDGVLYWASPKGIVRYSGGVPVVISQQIDIDTTNTCKAGTDGRKYYVCDGKKTYVYDTYYQMWHIEDEIVRHFYNHLNNLYAGGYGGVYKLTSGGESVEWQFETKDYTFGSKERKNLSKLWIRADMPKNSRLEVYVKQNGGEWQRVAVKTAEKDEMFDFKLRVKKCDSFALKFKGKGDVRILDIHGKITVGTSKHRSGASLNVYRK
jgi:hypothetical protein